MHNAIDIALFLLCTIHTYVESRRWVRFVPRWLSSPGGLLISWFPFERRLSVRLAYIFSYNLFQFCGHTWILTNMVVRFVTFGRDALADTFHSVGFVMSLCQLLSVLEIFHIADRLERARLLPRLVQVRNLLLIMLINLDEVQSKPIVCVQLFFWNILDLLRYPHEVMCVMDAPSAAMLWARYTLWIPIYLLSAVTEGDPLPNGWGGGETHLYSQHVDLNRLSSTHSPNKTGKRQF
uniref:Very-long-chain (3R)-3-hydroxyacyl-CoA dehydratase n=1 Tax=Hippocampus comes TaxID=109280 RepID=A0A3Q2XY87_HIPCM